MNDGFVCGHDINSCIVGSDSLCHIIRQSKLTYRYMGFELSEPDVPDECVEHLSKILFRESICNSSVLWAISCTSILFQDTPLALKKGYWGFQDRGRVAIPLDTHKLAIAFPGKVRLISITRIRSEEESNFLMNHSLFSNTIFLLDKTTHHHDFKILELIGKIDSDPWLRNCFLMDLLGSIETIDNIVMFLSGGFDYGALYLNIIENK